MLNLPPMTAALTLITVAIHLARWLLPESIDDMLIINLGVIPARYSVPELFVWTAVAAPLGYIFLHGGTLHLAMNMAMLVSFGSGVERQIGGTRMLLFYLTTGILAAFVHFIVYPLSTIPVIGASGAISGLFGGIVLLLYRRGGGQRRSFFTLVAIWVGFTVVTGVMGVPGEPDVDIAWVAHLGGFAAGLLLFGLFRRRY